MDHANIDEQQVAERYVMGRLPPDEAERFEEHYLHCGECMDRLEAAERLHRGLQRVAAEEVVTRAVVARAGLLAWLARAGRSRQAALLASLALAVAVLLPSGLLLREVGQRDRELETIRAELARRPTAAPTPPLAPVAPVVPDDRAARLEAERLEGELAAERQRSAGLAEDLDRARRPQVNLPVVPLSPVRSAPGGGEPPRQVTLPREPGWIVLSLELDAAEHPSYRATLLGPDRAVRWQSSGLEPDAADTLAIGLHSSQLAAGDFVLRIEGLPPGGKPVPVAEFPFRVR
ncbi:MAG TPA: hypothetical protein VMW27_07175 [Thermoanaerobaculia bacterium]|nr:hypothetical protein [Thermoanaerobaculia bacterium]